MGDFRIKYKNMSEITKLKTELEQVLSDNQVLAAKVSRGK
jgi:hypothetical protein